MPAETRPGVEAQESTLFTSHLGFIIKIYILSSIYLVSTTLYWFLITYSPTIFLTIIYNTQIGMLAGFFAYLGLLVLMNFYEFLLQRKWILWVLMITMVVFCSSSSAMAVSEAQEFEVLYTYIFIVVIILICVILSTHIQDSLLRDMNYLTLWSIRFYVIALMGIVLSTATRAPEVKAFLMMFTASFMTMFMFIFARSLSSSVLFEQNQSKDLFLALLFYFNSTSVWSAIVLTYQAAARVAREDQN